MKIATWNVNGIRARGAQVEQWLDAERPDVLCLQEIKASPEQVPMMLAARDDYWTCWHGSGGGISLAPSAARRTPPSTSSTASPA
jgi:exodeoxyribonuclease-3